MRRFVVGQWTKRIACPLHPAFRVAHFRRPCSPLSDREGHHSARLYWDFATLFSCVAQACVYSMAHDSSPQQLLLTCAQPEAGSCYAVSNLSVQDGKRAALRRGPKAQLDWRVSRALLHTCRSRTTDDCTESLSHSRGHALLAQAAPPCKLGVDMEMIRPRRVMALAEWACNAAEMDSLRKQADDAARLTGFYILWTLKEAFIKAQGLSFPADLSRYGLDCAANGAPPTLRAPDGAWQARTYRLGSDWIASVVWLPAGDEKQGDEPQWRAGPCSVLPPVTLLGAWR